MKIREVKIKLLKGLHNFSIDTCYIYCNTNINYQYSIPILKKLNKEINLKIKITKKLYIERIETLCTF